MSNKSPPKSGDGIGIGTGTIASASSTSNDGITRTSSTRDPEFRIENAPYEKRLPSCAECRRLKRRCDRKWPCQSCITRGCASICPNGSLSTEGSGSRSILRKIKEMSRRIGQLEDALMGIWQGSEVHPLLRPELLKIKSLPDTSVAEKDGDGDGGEIFVKEGRIKVEDETEELAADLDTLTLGANGKINYLGRTAKYEFILSSAEGLAPNRATAVDHPSPPSGSSGSDSSVPTPAPSLPRAITDLSHSFLLTAPLRNEITIDDLRRFLPSYYRAQHLVDHFYNNAGWFYSPCPREDFYEDIMAEFYPQEYQSYLQKGSSTVNSATLDVSIASSTQITRSHSAHDLALLFLVLAFGMQLEAPYATHSEDSEDYQTLSRAALALEPVTNGCSLSLIQTITLMQYRSHFDHNSAQQEFLWGVTGMAYKFALTMGLHRDCAKWGLSPKEVNLRRYVFWELFSCNCWASLGSGRPPAMEITHTDCQLPNDPNEKTAHSGKVINRSFFNWKHLFTKECLWPVIEQNFNLSKTFSYSQVLAVDRKIREFDLGSFERESLIPRVGGRDGNGMGTGVERRRKPNPNLGLLMQRWINKNCKDHVILHMHRLFFSRALSTHPESPLDSPFGSSVLAAFRCAVSLLQDVEVIYEQVPPECIPIGITFAYVLTSGMTMGSLCTKGPRGSLAPFAFVRLQSAVDLYQRFFGRSTRTSKYAAMLQGLLANSARAISAVGPGPTSNLGPMPNSNFALGNLGPVEASVHAQTRTQASSSGKQNLQAKEEINSLPTVISDAATSWQHNSSLVGSNTLATPAENTSTTYQPAVDTLFAIPSSSVLATHPSSSATTIASFIPLPTDSETDYSSFTLQHQPTTSYRPLGMPIPPDDFVWSEPAEGRPTKRSRYEEVGVGVVGSSGYSGYQGAVSGVGERVQDQVGSQAQGQGGHGHGHGQMGWLGHRTSSGNLQEHVQAQAQRRGVDFYQQSPQTHQHPQWVPHAHQAYHTRHPPLSGPSPLTGSFPILTTLRHPQTHPHGYDSPLPLQDAHSHISHRHGGHTIYDMSSSSPTRETHTSGISGPQEANTSGPLYGGSVAVGGETDHGWSACPPSNT